MTTTSHSRGQKETAMIKSNGKEFRFEQSNIYTPQDHKSDEKIGSYRRYYEQ